MIDPLRICYAGPLDLGGTCYSRLVALQSVEPFVHPFDTDKFLRSRAKFARMLDHFPRLSPVVYRLNAALLETIQKHRINLLWIDKGSWILKSTLRRLRQQGVVISHHLTDSLWPTNFRLRLTRRQLVSTACDYDFYFTSNERDAETLQAMTSGKVFLTQLGYDERRFSPRAKSVPVPGEKHVHSIVFVGHREPRTERGVCALIDAGLPVSVFGRNWVDRALSNPKLRKHAHPALGNEEYVEVLRQARIGLCFVSEWNYNQTAGRSYEIPACGTFLLAMRTLGHIAHYKEGIEAEFFADEAELVQKARQYLTDDAARNQIAQAGHRRCVSSGYSWREIMLMDWAKLRASLGPQ
jgi:spore maturation protein CgeB